ncbi:MAG: DUF4258 domain-containing protein [Candidatus Hydrogenedentes bacterium]|nr:DUF4258 domain-containing protein [Candidatus Hydrogenedentota bacterium]
MKYSGHALRQMFARRISGREIRDVISLQDIVKDYPQDNPYPSRLLLGRPGDRPIHVVLAYNAETGEGLVITVYEPDSALWETDFRSRRSK